MEPVYADFTVNPARFGNAVLRRERCSTTRTHLLVDAGGWVELRFEANGPRDTEQAVVTVNALVSKRGPRLGHAPIDVLVNGIPLIERHIIPGGDLPADTAVAVPGEHLVAGTNVLRIQSAAESRTLLWLYRITVDTVQNRAGAARALRRETAEAGSALAFRTERRVSGADSWLPAPRVLVSVDRGEYADLERLSWRGEDGAEASVSFHSSMVSFYGHHRAKDGTVSEFRGQQAGSRANPEQLAPAATHVFTTQEGWGGGWHDSAELRLLVDDGGTEVERVGWQDSAGNSGSVELHLPPTGPDGELTGLVTRVAANGQNPDAGEVAECLIDGTTATKWLIFSRAARLEFTLDRPVAVGSYELTSANDYPDRDPRDWTLSGSPDAVTWTVLDTRSGETFLERRQSRTFRIRRAGQVRYRHYRLDISGNAGPIRETQLARIRFFRPPVVAALGFLGYYQRAGEGPIGYRGTSVPARRPPTGLLAPGVRPATRGRASVATAARPGVPAGRAVPATRIVASAANKATPLRPKIPAVPAIPAIPAKIASKITGPEDAPLTTVEAWQAYLTDFGRDVVRTMNERERQGFAPDQLASGWLGSDPVDESRIAALEERLGTRLPPTYRAFVGASEGWHNIGQFMYVMRDVDAIDWFPAADSGTYQALSGAGDLGPLLRRSLLISKDGDAQYWFLDPSDVSPDGEWAAYTWSSWGFLSERHPSFAALVVAERQAMERLRGYHGAPMHPEGSDAVFDEARGQALRGQVEAALETFDRAAIKGSGAAAYLKVILGIFLKSKNGHHELRNGVFGRSHVMAAIGLEQLRAEAVPLFLHLTEQNSVGSVPGNLQLLEDLLPLLPSERAERSQGTDTLDSDEEAARRLFDPNGRVRTQLTAPELNVLREKLIARAAGFTPPVLPESPAFQAALDEARALVRAGAPDDAWAVIEAALPGWRSDSPTRVAPVILLTDPVLSTLITPSRSRQIVRTPRGFK